MKRRCDTCRHYWKREDDHLRGECRELVGAIGPIGPALHLAVVQSYLVEGDFSCSLWEADEANQHTQDPPPAIHDY